jgi:hypothetical protein
VCGPIEGVFLYHTDGFIQGGCNIIAECIRQAVNDVRVLLSNHKDYYGNPQPLILPKELIVQADNCTENKVTLTTWNIYFLYLLSCLTEQNYVRIFFISG